MSELQDTLPSGWDRKWDPNSNKFYYINHYTKTTTWDDPRGRHPVPRPRHATPSHGIENIPLQHGSPEFRRNYVYPSQTSPIPAFQIPGHYSPKTVTLQEFNNVARNSPRSSRVQDSTLATSSSDTEQSVGKIISMFPTVSDTHIRILLKKFHNREAVVISALQVEKHPIVTPGPFATPPPARNIHHAVHAHLHSSTPPLGIRAVSRGGSPILRTGSGGSSYLNEAYRSSPRPHSPKLKLRYMKSIFPKAEETIILEVLCSNDDNIQKASDVLKEMGYERREMPKALLHHSSLRTDPIQAQEQPPAPPARRHVVRDPAEKIQIKAKMQEKYKDIPEQVIMMALESAEYNEERAGQILQVVVQEEIDKNSLDIQANDEINEDAITKADTIPIALPSSQSRQSLKSLLKTEKSEYSLKQSTSFSRIIEESGDNMSGYRSPYLTSTTGANRGLVKGTNHELLLEDYVKWHGPNPSLRQGSKHSSLAKGPNASLRITRVYQPCGPNSELRKGPKFGLAKGSIFTQLKEVIVGDSRGK